ncbi:MAG: bifunctional aminotransferase class I/II-fold pyridoxal phosphate-dependent enzyme/GNAT family N-acetyltransferase [Cyclobacteriaceae bacterium]
MAKIRHNNIIDTATEIFSLAKDNSVLHLYAEDEVIDGRHITLNGQKALNFGTCGYLRLEHHPKLKAASIDAIHRYGTQFPLSKSYVSSPLYAQLESSLEQMYGASVVVSKNCTIAHLATIPTLIREDEAVIMDHLVHSSVQAAVQKLLPKGVNVEMIRHNNMQMLEDTVIKLKDKYRRIWYMADGVYSMYGDFAPIHEMVALADKYEQLHLYVDDAHGTSWKGKHGTGYVMDQLGNQLHEKMILTATLGKAFGACGGATLFANKEWHHAVKIFGGPNTFSVQLEPAILGSAVASAELHLSDEIYEHQKELESRINYCNKLLDATQLPLIERNESPIFFIGTGTMAMTSNLIQRMCRDGVYVNAAPFPAVPAKNTGVRITVSLNNDYDQIEEMVQKLEHHYEASLAEVGQTHEKVRKAFKLDPLGSDQKKEANTPHSAEELKLETFDKIEEIDESTWNERLGHRGMFDWNGMQFLQTSFSGNEKPEHNWDFKYFMVKDHTGEVILLTFCIVGIWKDDTFSRASISKQIEETRASDYYYLTSKAVIMGSMFTEGEHLYINREKPYWNKALFMLIDSMFKLQDQCGANNLIFRDFPAEDEELKTYMLQQGFVKMDMPESCVVEDLSWETQDQFIDTLTKRGKKHFREEVRRYEKYFDVEVKKTLDNADLKHAIELFRQVKGRNYAINSFDFPDKLFEQISKDPDWEIVTLRIKEEYEKVPKPIGYGFCHKNCIGAYSGMFVGLDYNYVYKYGAYRQGLYQTVKRAKALSAPRVNLGVSATIEKKKMGAKVYPRVAYVNAKDNFIMEMIGSTLAVEQD